MTPPTHLIWKLEVLDAQGNVIASLFRHANAPASVAGPGIAGNPTALSEALRDLALCNRFFPFHDHPHLPCPPLDPSSN